MSKKKIATKSARGIAFGDAANIAVRNILSEISKSLLQPITEQYLLDAAQFFDYKCPYTGRDIRAEIMAKDCSALALDHIVPHNKTNLGLNTEGNVILVDKLSNSAKNDLNFEEFLLTDTKVLGALPLADRQARIAKIKAFQAHYSYDQSAINTVIADEIRAYYEDVKERQKKFAEHLTANLNRKCFKINVHLKDYTDYLEKSLSTNTAYCYASSLKQVLVREGLTLAKLDSPKTLGALITAYARGGAKYDANNKGKMLAALKNYAKFKGIKP